MQDAEYMRLCHALESGSLTIPLVDSTHPENGEYQRMFAQALYDAYDGKDGGVPANIERITRRREWFARTGGNHAPDAQFKFVKGLLKKLNSSSRRDIARIRKNHEVDAAKLAAYSHPILRFILKVYGFRRIQMLYLFNSGQVTPGNAWVALKVSMGISVEDAVAKRIIETIIANEQDYDASYLPALAYHYKNSPAYVKRAISRAFERCRRKLTVQAVAELSKVICDDKFDAYVPYGGIVDAYDAWADMKNDDLARFLPALKYLRSPSTRKGYRADDLTVNEALELVVSAIGLTGRFLKDTYDGANLIGYEILTTYQMKGVPNYMSVQIDPALAQRAAKNLIVKTVSAKKEIRRINSLSPSDRADFLADLYANYVAYCQTSETNEKSAVFDKTFGAAKLGLVEIAPVVVYKIMAHYGVGNIAGDAYSGKGLFDFVFGGLVGGLIGSSASKPAQPQVVVYQDPRNDYYGRGANETIDRKYYAKMRAIDAWRRNAAKESYKILTETGLPKQDRIAIIRDHFPNFKVQRNRELERAEKLSRDRQKFFQLRARIFAEIFMWELKAVTSRASFLPFMVEMVYVFNGLISRNVKLDIHPNENEYIALTTYARALADLPRGNFIGTGKKRAENVDDFTAKKRMIEANYAKRVTDLKTEEDKLRKDQSDMKIEYTKYMGDLNALIAKIQEDDRDETKMKDSLKKKELGDKLKAAEKTTKISIKAAAAESAGHIASPKKPKKEGSRSPSPNVPTKKPEKKDGVRTPSPTATTSKPEKKEKSGKKDGVRSPSVSSSASSRSSASSASSTSSKSGKDPKKSGKDPKKSGKNPKK